jgi:hypothetical protein
MKMRKVMMSASALALATPLLFIGTASQANAVSLAVKPAVSCTAGAEIIYSINIMSGSTVVGNIQLKYSPLCRVTWARVISNLGLGSSALIQSNSSPSLHASCSGTGGAGTGYNTAMINDNGITSYAEGTVNLGTVGNTTSITTQFTPSF